MKTDKNVPLIKTGKNVPLMETGKNVPLVKTGKNFPQNILKILENLKLLKLKKIIC